LSQLPPAGTQVRRGWQIRLAQSLGPQRVEIPNVLGQSERAADINIRRHGLDVGAIAQLRLPGTPGDQVVSQAPPPSASGVSAPKISLLVTSPPQPQAFIMPNFVGQPLGGATLALQDAGMRVGAVTVAAVAPETAMPQVSPASVIVAQTPTPGEKVAAGTAVNFQVQ
jgi:beta-lactam-binding protein with PASTA domain